ncbi:hypothetical protein F5X97DRAFT_297025 [Nemania serpens]|nr:hypothetical protein F5X97DRAFT_297025 [Nemania serpens]
MSFSTKAFDLTAEDQHVMLGEIKSLLLLANAAILKAKQSGSWDDYDEAHRHLEEAFLYATDPNACDPSLAPLATCYLYKGHIHLGLGQCAAAYEAYEEAAASEAHALTDVPAARDAVKKAMEIRDRAEAEKEATGKTGTCVRGGSGCVWGLVSGAKRWEGKGTGGKVGWYEALSAGAYGVRLPVGIHGGLGRRGEVLKGVGLVTGPDEVAIIKMRVPRRGPGLGPSPARPADLKLRRAL